jgi:hypothetical protein
MLQIHILRSDRGPDDIISIHQNLNGDFVVVYSDHESSVRYTFRGSCENIVSYLWAVFDFLRIDEEPFEKVQIVSPVHPSIMMKVRHLTDTKVRTVVNTLRNLLYNWPRSLASFS